MGKIADMHVEAYEAGLDPNEMDGADWADLYEDEGPKTPADFIAFLSEECRMLLRAIDDLQDPDDFDVAKRADTINLYVPAFSQADAEDLVRLVASLNEKALAEEDRLTNEEGHQK